MKRADDDASMTSSRWRMSASRDYELSPDLREKQVEMLCRRYGGAELASGAARVIQHAYRRYRLSRSFARIRLQAAGTTHVEKRLSRCFADVDAALADTVGGICCRVRARHVELTDPHGDVDAVRWTVSDRRHQNVSLTSRHHARVVVGSGCCVNADTCSVTSSDDRPAVSRPTPAVSTVVVDDQLVTNTAVPRCTSNDDQLTDLAQVHELAGEDQPTTFQQLCLTDSSYGDMTVDSDTDDTGPQYVEGEALEAVVVPRSHVYSSLRLCNWKQSALASQPNDSPIWKRKDVVVVGGGDDSKETTTLRCVGCGWRGQSAPQLNDLHAGVPTGGSASVSTGSLAAIGNCCCFTDGSI